MRVLLLCAGYGTRFLKDVEFSETFHHLKGIPKPLLPVAGKPLISHWLDLLEAIGCPADNVCVVVNDHYIQQYRDWREKMHPKVVLVNDGSASNETRLGAVACIALALEKAVGFQDDVLVIAGDTLLDKSFDPKAFFEFFRVVNEEHGSSSVIVDTHCTDDEVCKRGIIETDFAGRVLTFLEKPKSSETPSRKQCPCFYLLHSTHLRLVGEFLDANKTRPLEEKDATGNLLRYLIEVAHVSVFSMSVTKRYDVGNLKAYLECCNELELNQK